MLGKGLESLIPQKGNGQGPSGDVNSRPPASEPIPPVPATQPVVWPVRRKEHADFNSPAPAPAPAQKPEPKREEHSIVGSVFHIEIEKIVANPDQPRRHFDQAALQDLAHSIREFGFLQPVVVSKSRKETDNGLDVEYELIAGERRLMAAKMLGLRSVPAIVRNVSLEREKLELAVIENIQRENLNPIETARAFQRLQEEFRMTQREIAAKLGKSREVVANSMRLLDLPEYIRIAVEQGQLSESNARFLISIGDPGAQKGLFDDILAHKLTTRDVKERVDRMGGHTGRRGRPPKTTLRLAPELRAMQETLSSDIGAPVEINKGATKGSITITFYSEEELENILRRLQKENG